MPYFPLNGKIYLHLPVLNLGTDEVVMYVFMFCLLGAYLFSDINTAPTLSMSTMMGYSSTTPINNKIAHINSIS